MKSLFILCLAFLLTSFTKAAHVHNDISPKSKTAADVVKVIGGIL
jgi:hypothetical protein